MSPSPAVTRPSTRPATAIPLPAPPLRPAVEMPTAPKVIATAATTQSTIGNHDTRQGRGRVWYPSPAHGQPVIIGLSADGPLPRRGAEDHCPSQHLSPSNEATSVIRRPPHRGHCS